MSDHRPDTPAEGGVRSESADVHPGLVVRFAVALILVIVASAGVLFWMFRALEGRRLAQEPPPRPLAQDEDRRPPEPRLQQRPFDDIRRLRADQERLLASYGRDPKTGALRIPIEAAMEALAQRGLPERRPQPGGREAGR